MDFCFRGKNGHAADITATTDFDPNPALAGLKSRSAAVSCRIVCAIVMDGSTGGGRQRPT
jgi:hypothetical protein